MSDPYYKKYKKYKQKYMSLIGGAPKVIDLDLNSNDIIIAVDTDSRYSLKILIPSAGAGDGIVSSNWNGIDYATYKISLLGNISDDTLRIVHTGTVGNCNQIDNSKALTLASLKDNYKGDYTAPAIRKYIMKDGTNTGTM